MALNGLFGTWKLMSHQFVTTDGQDRREMFGPDPEGYLVITPDSRMMTLITAKDRQAALDEAGNAALFKSLLAYCGPIRIEGEDQFIVNVDAAWQPGWVGGQQARTFVLDGDNLSIMTPETLHPMFPGRTARGVLTWQRISRF